MTFTHRGDCTATPRPFVGKFGDDMLGCRACGSVSPVATDQPTADSPPSDDGRPVAGTRYVCGTHQSTPLERPDRPCAKCRAARKGALPSRRQRRRPRLEDQLDQRQTETSPTR